VTYVDRAMVQGLGLDRARGAIVREVVVDGPAARAGIAPGDVIVAFEGIPIEDSSALPLIAGEAGVGRRVNVGVVRDGKALTLPVTLGDHPDNRAPADGTAASRTPRQPSAPVEKEGSLGIVVVTLDADDRARLKLRGDVTGTRITKVRPGSPAFEQGLEPDDVIVRVNGSETPSASDFATLVRRTPAGELLRILVLRGSSTVFVPLVRP
jgi:serine protease Do